MENENGLQGEESVMVAKGVFANDPEILRKIEEAKGAGELGAVLEGLLVLERLNRLAAAAPETAEVCVAIVDVCFERKEWGTLCENLVLLSKRRAQLKQAVTRMVTRAMEFLDQTPDPGAKLSLMTTLRDVTSGKIYVELQGARLTRMLAALKEEKGDVTGAAEIMQELQVETFGAMDRREKTDFILEQIRLCLAKRDFIRAGIISKKITAKALADETMIDLKIRFHALMIRIHQRNKEYLEIARAYLAGYETRVVQNDPAAWQYELKLAILFLVLSPSEPMQQHLIHQIRGYKETEALPEFGELLKLFTSDEIVQWPSLKQRFEIPLDQIITSSRELDMNDDEDRLDWRSALHERVVEHNLRVISKYFSRIRISRLAELLNLSEDESEDRLIRQVSDKKALWAKIDRPRGIVAFAREKEPDECLNEWSGSITTLLDTIEKTCHLVHKEFMVHKIEVPE